MKKLLLLFFTLLLPLVARSADVSNININGIYYNLYDINKKAAVTYYQNFKYSGEVTIPAAVTYNDNQYSVTYIGSDAFRDCTGLTSITIPNSVTNIGGHAFLGCTGLTSITIPNSVTNIESSTFSGCTGLTSITIPNSVTSIGGWAFKGCTGLTSITIPNSVTSIGQYAFHGCSGLTSITIPNSVTSIRDHAFYECTGLTSINIPNSVTNIGGYAFYGCTGLTSINIPNSVTNIGEHAFLGCTGLTSITIPNSVTSIGDGAFYGCTGLTSINIPNSVTKIGQIAFHGCSGLTSITIPNSVTSIRDKAFYDCKNLKSVYCYATKLPETSENTFGSYDGHQHLKYATLYVPASAINEYKKATVPWMWFGTILPIDAANTDTYSVKIDGIHYNLFDKDKTAEVTSSNQPGYVIIPEAVTYNDNQYSVTSIGDEAFYGCTRLTSITIPNSVTSIGSGAFYGCTGLKSITIPNSVTSIGDEAFYGCKNLKTVYCYATKLPETNENTSGIHVIYINYATLYVPASAINEYKATAPWRWFGTILPIEDATTQIDATSTNDYNITTNGNDIIVKSDADGEKVSIYTINGQLIGTTAIRNGSAVINTNLKSGSVAIVMIGQNTYKIRLD